MMKKNCQYNMLTDNGINTILDFLSMPFKNIEDIEVRVDNRCIKLSLTNTNRLNILKSFHIYNAQKRSPLNVNDWMGKPITSSQYNPVHYFTEGIEKDIKAFLKLKDSKKRD